MTRDGNSEEFSPDEGPRTPDAEGVPETRGGSRRSAAELAQWLGGHEFFRVTLRDGQVIAQVELRESPSEYGRYLREHSTPCAEAAPLPAASGAPDAPASAPEPAEWLQTLPPARRSLLLHLMSLPAGVAARYEAAQQQQELATRQWAAARYRQLARDPATSPDPMGRVGRPAPGITPPTEYPSAATSPRCTAIDAVQVRDMVRHEVRGLAQEFLRGLAPGALASGASTPFRPRPP